MQYYAFSKIWILITLIVFIGGGIFAWQYFGVPGKEAGDETANWNTYENKEYGFEIKYPQDWDYTILEMPNTPIMFAPQDIITKTKQSITSIESDKSFTLWITIYDKVLFEGGILPYRGKSNEYIKVISSDVDVNGVKGNYYISEYLKDKGSYKTGEKTATIDLPLKNGYLSMNLFDYQYVNIFEKMLSSFKFIEGGEIGSWQTYKNQEFGFEIKYPGDWKVAENLFVLKPSLVFCPANLATDPDPEVICKLKTGAAKPQYEDGMIYLFKYDKSVSKPNNPAYRFLGLDSQGNYYYLYPTGNNELILNQMLPTFRFLR